MRPASMRVPSVAMTAGRTVTDPTTATATTIIVPIAIEVKVPRPARSMPDIATITVKPETITARPEVAAAMSRASAALRPARRSSRARWR